MIFQKLASIRALNKSWPSLAPRTSAWSSFVRACSTGDNWNKKQKVYNKAKPRSDRLDEEVYELQKVTQKAANILCGLSERTTTHKVLYVGVEPGGDDGKTFSYFLGESTTFDVSGVGEDSQELDAIKHGHNYSEVYPFTKDGGIQVSFDETGFNTS